MGVEAVCMGFSHQSNLVACGPLSVSYCIVVLHILLVLLCVCICACVFFLYSHLEKLQFCKSSFFRVILFEMLDCMMSQAVWRTAFVGRTLRFWRYLEGSTVIEVGNVRSYWRKLLPCLQYKHSNTSPFICLFCRCKYLPSYMYADLYST
jgi:hypothetical protein